MDERVIFESRLEDDDNIETPPTWERLTWYGFRHTFEQRVVQAELERDARPTSAKAHLHDCYDVPWLVLDYLTADEADMALHDLIAVERDNES